MEDILLQRAFEKDRWYIAIEKAVTEKHMDKADMRKLCEPLVRAELYLRIKHGTYNIAPPHTALIPKDTPNEFRTVYVNENIDRIYLSIINDLIMELCSDFIHPQCKSYQKGIGCGKVVKETIETVKNVTEQNYGFKADLSKFFDNCSIESIDNVFAMIEDRVGKSPALDVVKTYYHSDLFFDTDGELKSKYQSLKQGCAFASALADMILFNIDDTLTNMAAKSNGYYARYSDDIVYIGNDWQYAMELLKEMLVNYGLSLNPKKVEVLDKDKYFTFLGFAIRKDDITLSKNRIKTFQKEIDNLTSYKTTPTKALNNISRYLYVGNGEYSWATNVLPIITNEHDIQLLNAYVMDRIRACYTQRHKTGGVGYCPDQKYGVVCRGIGKNVKLNKEKTPKHINGYLSLMKARNAMLSSKNAYETLVRELKKEMAA